MPEQKEMVAVIGTGGLAFKHLPAYARYLLKNKLEFFSDEIIRLSREVQLPLLAYLESFPTHQRRQIALQSSNEFLSYLSENKASELIQLSINNWLSGNLPALEREQVGFDDIMLVCYIRKKSFLKFLPDYTDDQALNNRVISEIDDFTKEFEAASHHILRSFHTEAINGKRHMIRRIEHTEELYEQAQKITHIGNWVWMVNQDQIAWSNELYRIYGLEPQSEEITFERFISLVHPDDRELVQQHVQRSLATKEPNEFYHRIVLDNGTIKTLHAKGEVVADEQGNIYKMIGTGQDVTDRQNLIERLQKTEQLSKHAEALAHIGNWNWDIATNKITWSDELYRIYGLEPQSEQITFDRFRAFIHPDDREKRMHQIQRSLQTLEAPDYLMRIVTDDGVEKTIFGKGAVIADKNGKALKLVGTCQDVTEQKLREKEMRELNQHLEEKEENIRHLIQNAPDAVIVVDEEGKVMLWNPQAEHLFGWSAKEAEGTLLVENIIPPQQRALFTEEIKIFFDSGEHLPNKIVELAAISKTGNRLSVSLAVSKTVQGGKPAFVAFLRDISEKKKAEAELNESRTQLEKLYAQLEQNYEELERSYTELIRVRRQLADDRTRFIITSMPHIVASATADGMLDYANQRLMDFTGLSFEELKGWGWSKCIYPEDLNMLSTAWMNSLQTGKPMHIEFMLMNAAGKPYWHLAKVKPHLDEKGEITMWIASITDIHEHRMLEEKKDEFIGIASHELKTPLTSAKAYMQLLESQLGKEADAESALYVQKANSAIDRINNLISELLDISKIQHGKLPLSFNEFDFDEMIDEAIELIQQTSPTHRITKSGKANKLMKGDKERLQQVCVNLLTNAVKYSPEADRVEVKITNDYDEMLIAVTDYGIGIPKGEQEKIFDRFYRVNGVGPQYQGLGIGLFITAEIIQRHHGKIWVKSELGRGSTFYFTLPFKFE